MKAGKRKGIRLRLRIEVMALALLAGLLLPAGCVRQQSHASLVIGNMEEISEAIRSAMIRRRSRINISFETSSPVRDQIEDLAAQMIETAFAQDQDPHSGDYLRYQSGGYTLKYKETKDESTYSYIAGILPVYYTSSEQEEEVDGKITEIIAGFGLDDGASDYQKLCCVRDYICDHVSYDTVHKHMPGSKHTQSTAYAALFYHTALCQGYAVLCYRLLKELGLDVRIVTGTALVGGKKEKHAWNIVCLDGKYYNLDVTMDDVSGTRDYFLKCDQTLAASHDRDEEYQSEDFCKEYPMALKDYQ